MTQPQKGEVWFWKKSRVTISLFHYYR